MSRFKGNNKDRGNKKQRGAKNNPEPEQEVAVGRPDKHGGELAKVLDDSVWEASHEDFKANTKFILNDGGETRYVGLLFDTKTCGGLTGRNAKKDEAKGSIIEAIRGSRIRTYRRNEMLRDDSFVIVPDEDTLAAMDEFNLFRQGEYILCLVNKDGNVRTVTENGTGMDDDPEVKVNLKQILAIHEGADVHTLFPTPSISESSGDRAEELVEETGGASTSDDDAEPMPEEHEAPAPIQPNARPVEKEPEETQEEVDEAPQETSDDPFDDMREQDDAPSDDDGGLPDVGDESDVPPAPVPTPAPAASPAPELSIGPVEPVSGEPQPLPQEDIYPDITEEMVRDFVVQRFYSDDLGLEISTQPFDAQFVHGNPYIPFNENRGDGWLNGYLSNIAKDANTRMRRLHIENLFRVRERYMRLMQAHCENIAKALDITSTDTDYGQLRMAIDQEYDNNLGSVQTSVSAKRKQLEDAWNEQLRQVGEKGAMDARQEYIARHEAQHNADLARLDQLERDEIERDHNNQMARLQSDRRREASQMLDLAINSTLLEMSTIYLRVLDEEKKEYARLQGEMTKFIDGNRKDEKTRIEALAEANRQAKRADEVRAEFAAKIKSMAAEFDAKRNSLQADLDRINREHNYEITRMKNDMNDRIEQERAHSQQLQLQVDDLVEKLAHADEAANDKYRGRIAQLEKENSDFAAQYKHVVTTHKHASTLSVFLIAAAVLAAIGIGFALGTIINLRNTSKIEQTGVYNYMQGYADGENDARAVLSDGTEVIIDGDAETQEDSGQTAGEGSETTESDGTGQPQETDGGDGETVTDTGADGQEEAPTQ